MLKNSFFKTIPFLLFTVLFISCDKEYSAIGADLIGDNSLGLVKTQSTIVAYNQKINTVQSDDLAVNAFGAYNNPSFGSTTSNFVTQLNLTTVNPTLGATAKIKSVVLTIPYFYDKTNVKTDTKTGAKTYVLESIYGDVNAKMKLSVYRSGYFMTSLDPEQQYLKFLKYYSNQNSVFDAAKIATSAGTPLNNDPNKAQNTEFFFDPAEYFVDVINASGVKVPTPKPPAMHLDLDKDYFQNVLVLNAPAGSLTTNALFKEYFNGLYFNAENATCLNMINFRQGDVTITYTVDEVTNGVSKPVEKTLVMNMLGTPADPIRTVSLLTQTNTDDKYTQATKNDLLPDDNLYLKGGEGSMSVLSLFGPDNFGSNGISGAKNDVSDELDVMRTNKYLINDASLILNVNSELMGTSTLPQKIYLYDYVNSLRIFDDGGILTKATAADGGGYYYKFRITSYVRNLINNSSSKNVQLGVAVTEDINNVVFADLKNPSTLFTKVPKASVMSPLGVIIYGATSAVLEAKRLKLEIYYTKPN